MQKHAFYVYSPVGDACLSNAAVEKHVFCRAKWSLEIEKHVFSYRNACVFAEKHVFCRAKYRFGGPRVAQDKNTAQGESCRIRVLIY